VFQSSLSFSVVFLSFCFLPPVTSSRRNLVRRSFCCRTRWNASPYATRFRNYGKVITRLTCFEEKRIIIKLLWRANHGYLIVYIKQSLRKNQYWINITFSSDISHVLDSSYKMGIFFLSAFCVLINNEIKKAIIISTNIGYFHGHLLLFIPISLKLSRDRPFCDSCSRITWSYADHRRVLDNDASVQSRGFYERRAYVRA